MRLNRECFSKTPLKLKGNLRFSRPPRSTTPASLRRLKSKNFSGFYGRFFIKVTLETSHLDGKLCDLQATL